MPMRLYGDWSVKLPDETYTWTPDDMTLGEVLMVENETGTSFDEWVEGIDQRRAIPCQVLVWFLRRKDGRQEDRMSVEFPVRRLNIVQLETEDEVDADPEASAGSKPATSDSSPTSTESDRGNGTDSPGLTSVA